MLHHGNPTMMTCGCVKENETIRGTIYTVVNFTRKKRAITLKTFQLGVKGFYCDLDHKGSLS